jgi:NNP family nitrate/nitrite transporter-like MFS transporter
MSSDIDKKAWWILTASTLSFTICFAVWMLNGVLITFLVDHGIFKWGPSEMGWLIGIPVLAGAVFRLPLGVATDRWGGRLVNTVLLLVTAVPMFLLGSCNTYWQFFFASLGFGLAGSSFAVGIAYTSVWFPRRFQGTALGIFGSGNAGAALTVLIAPYLLGVFTAGGENPDGWRWLPRIYAGVLVVTAIVFLLTTTTRIAASGGGRTFGERLRPLASMRVWRFGLYYFFVFGGFVALAQWLVPYYVNAYGTTVVLAGILTAIFSFPSGVIRALGGWMSDRWGARPVLYWVFGTSIICCALLIVPQMDIHAPGSGVMARRAGVVTEVTANSIVVESDGFDPTTYEMSPKDGDLVSQDERRSGTLVFPRGMSWHEPTVEVGQQVGKKELIARGITHIFFQANIWIFTALCFIIGSLMGIGKAAVYKHIPEYFPADVGVAAGMVGVLGGLGGFVLPVVFGYLLSGTGLWTTSWMFLLVVACICLLWMHRVVRRITRECAPELLRRIE